MRSIAARSGLWLACLVALGSAGSARAADELIPGKIHLVKFGIITKMVAKPITPAVFNLPAGDPTAEGGQIEVFDTVGGGAGSFLASLPSSGWKALGNPPGSTGYKYKGAGTPSDPCRVGIVKEKVIKFVCKGAGVTLVPPYAGNSGIVFTVGSTPTTRYCAEFGGTEIKNTSVLFKHKDAPPPSGCPVQGTTSTSTSSTSTSSTSSTSTSSTSSSSTSSTSSSSTSSTSSSSSSSSSSSTSITSTSSSSSTSTSSTSSTSSSSTSSTSSTTSSTVAGCCNNAMAVSFLTFDVPGDCGDLVLAGASPPPPTNLACSGLYTGGGGNTVPLPFTVPDQGFAINAITTCTGQTATLGATTSTDTGSNLSCTAPGCLFGAPLAVPNPGSTPTSVCVLNSVGGTANGMLDCSTGSTSLDLPLNSEIFLTGDSTTEPGIQPCPVCRGLVGSEVCIGGVNDTDPCDPGTSDLSGHLSYPTSHDCPPIASLSIGTLPVAFSLSTGTVTWSGTTATNDPQSTIANMPRVFAGYCRDKQLPGATGAFESPAHQCWQNTMAFGTPCDGIGTTFETCEQRTEGAFGPNGGASRTITMIGNGMSILSGSGTATLVSVFAIAPTFNATVDGAGDLPGPGAVSLVGTATLCSTAGTCP